MSLAKSRKVTKNGQAPKPPEEKQKWWHYYGKSG